jgi:hypothetical protein
MSKVRSYITQSVPGKNITNPDKGWYSMYFWDQEQGLQLKQPFEEK